MLNGEQIELILIAAAQGVKNPVDGEEAAAMYEKLKVEVEDLKAQGLTVDVPGF